LSELAAVCRDIKVISVLQCAGNRAKEMEVVQNKLNNFSGTAVIWCGMMGNAEWSGMRFREALELALPGALEGDLSSKHVEFTGLDGYRCSSPLEHLINPDNDVLLATKMNGAPLPRDHGFPVRVLIPGHAGARSVKWLQEIRVLDAESTSPWNQRFYKKDGASVTALPMQSLILNPNFNADLHANGESSLSPLHHLSRAALEVNGIAWGGGSGETIASVELSSDQGKSWHAATLNDTEKPCDDSHRTWGWVRWNAVLNISNIHSEPVELLVRATDRTGLSQPETQHNVSGYLYNAYHRVKIPENLFQD
jgi:sulfite oxidase